LPRESDTLVDLERLCDHCSVGCLFYSLTLRYGTVAFVIYV
jgi:hypothetical protein